ncbi:MAG TPA: hypothetical protein VFM01_11290 [Nakamurella sp.]|nr:hypothetical protein [Nakamurella sp.]
MRLHNGIVLRTGILLAAAITAVAVATFSASAAPARTAGGNGAVVSHGTLMQLNDSGVQGTVTLVEHNGQIRANLQATGLEPMQMHMQHIHGFSDGVQATCPDMSLAGADGVLSFAEGLPAYGPVQVTLGHDMVDGSTLQFSRTFAATDAGAAVGTLGSLDQYVIVVHGLTVAGTFDMTLPVACAVLTINGA